MRKTFVFLMFIIVLTSFTFAETSSSSINWASHRYVNENFCQLNAPTCIFLGNVTFAGDVAIIGDVFNITVHNLIINATTIVGLNDSIGEYGNDTYIRRTGDTGVTGTISGDYKITTTGIVQADTQVTTPLIETAGTTDVLSIQPNATQEDVAVKFFENVDAVNNQHPEIEIYGWSDYYGEVGIARIYMNRFKVLNFRGMLNVLFDAGLKMTDDYLFTWGSGNDVDLGWIQTGVSNSRYNFLRLDLIANSSISSQTIVITENNRNVLVTEPPTVTGYPTLDIHDGSTTQINRLRLFHNGSGGNVQSLFGDLNLNAESSIIQLNNNSLINTGTGNQMGALDIGGGFGDTGISLYENGSADFDGDVNVEGTIYAKAINISNSSFSFSHNENNSIDFSIENLNNGSGATSLIRTLNDVGGIFGIGIASSNYLLGNMLKPNMTALFSRSQGEMTFINSFKQSFVWYNNPSDDDDLNNLVEIMRADENGLNVSKNITAENVFLLADISAHTNVTMPVISAGEWVNVTFDQDESTPVKDITHIYNDGTNDTFTIVHTGTYELRYTITVADSNPTPGTHIAVRLIKNGIEIDGSLLEEDSTRQYADFTIGNGPHSDLAKGDKIKLQFTASGTTVDMESHATYGEHKDSATIKIKRIR